MRDILLNYKWTIFLFNFCLDCNVKLVHSIYDMQISSVIVLLIEEGTMINLAIIDSQHIFREGLQRLIEVEDDAHIVASEKQFSDLTEEQILKVDLFLIDIEALKDERSLINRLVLRKFPDKKIVALSSETGKNDVTRAVLAGSHGFLLKEMSYPKFIQAVRMIAEQGAFIHPHVLQHIIKEYRILSRKGASTVNVSRNGVSKDRVCTTREHEILQLLVNGNDNNSIAEELGISEKTVKNHLTNIFRKLDVKDRTQAAVLAIRNEWVEL